MARRFPSRSRNTLCIKIEMPVVTLVVERWLGFCFFVWDSLKTSASEMGEHKLNENFDPFSFKIFPLFNFLFFQKIVSEIPNTAQYCLHNLCCLS
jgi:hypothetical protein